MEDVHLDRTKKNDKYTRVSGSTSNCSRSISVYPVSVQPEKRTETRVAIPHTLNNRIVKTAIVTMDSKSPT